MVIQIIGTLRRAVSRSPGDGGCCGTQQLKFALGRTALATTRLCWSMLYSNTPKSMEKQFKSDMGEIHDCMQQTKFDEKSSSNKKHVKSMCSRLPISICSNTTPLTSPDFTNLRTTGPGAIFGHNDWNPLSMGLKA